MPRVGSSAIAFARASRKAAASTPHATPQPAGVRDTPVLALEVAFRLPDSRTSDFRTSRLPDFPTSRLSHYLCPMILITGATGLVGSHLLLRLLDEGKKVRALYRSDAKKEGVRKLFAYYGKERLFDQADWIQGDITDIPSLENAFRNIETVYHCAALISFNPDDEEALRKVNIEGTANVVNLCLSHHIRKLCHASSIAALGDLPDGQTVNDEQSDWNPEKLHSDYAISKYGAEMEVWRGQQEGLSVIIVNPGIIIGPMPDKTSGTAELFLRMEQGQSFFTDGMTAVVAVSDVVGAMVRLTDSDISGEKYILSAENVTYEDLMTQVATALHVRPPSKRATRAMTGIAWRVDWLLSLLGRKRRLSKAAAQSLHSQETYSSDKIKKVLDFRFTPVQAAIKETAAYWKAN